MLPSELTIKEVNPPKRPDFKTITDIISSYSIYILVLEAHIAETYGSVPKTKQKQIKNNEKFLSIVRDVSSGKAMPLEDIHKVLTSIANELFEETEMFLSEFIGLDRSLRIKLTTLQQDFQRKLLFTFFLATASFVEKCTR